MEETHVTSDLFTKAKEFLFKNPQLSTTEKDLFERVSKIMNEKMDTKGFITCDDAKDIGFLHGCNIYVLSRIVSTFLISKQCDINLLFKQEMYKSNFYRCVLECLNYFSKWEECEFMYYEEGPLGITVYQNKYEFSSSVKVSIEEVKEVKEMSNFKKASIYLDEHLALKLRADQLYALTLLMKETDQKNMTKFSDIDGIGLPRRGGNTLCLARMVASLFVSRVVKVEVEVENQRKSKEFSDLLVHYITRFNGTPFASGYLSCEQPGKIITMNHQLNIMSVVHIIISGENALNYLNENHPVKLTEDQREKVSANMVKLQSERHVYTVRNIDVDNESYDFQESLTRPVAVLLISEKSIIRINHFNAEEADKLFLSLQENIDIFEKSPLHKSTLLTIEKEKREITFQTFTHFSVVEILVKKEKTLVEKALDFINEQKQHQLGDEEIKTMKLHIEKVLEYYRKDETKVVQMNDINDLNILKTIGALTRVIVALSVSEKISIQLSVSNEAVLNVAYETLKNLFKLFNHTKLVPFCGISSKSIGNTREIDVLRHGGNSTISIIVKEMDPFHQALDYFTKDWRRLGFVYSKEKVKLISENVLERVKDGKLTLSVSDEISLENLVVITLSLLVSKPLKIIIEVSDTKSLDDFFIHVQQNIFVFNNHKVFSSQITKLDTTMKRLSLRSGIISESFLEVVIIGPKPLRKLSFGKKQNDAVKVALQMTVVKEPPSLILEKDIPLEIALEKIHATVSSKLREPVTVLFSFIYGKVPKVVMKELDGKLSIQLNDGLSLMIEEGKVIFKSFISETFIYPSQYDKIVIALNLYFNAKI